MLRQLVYWVKIPERRRAIRIPPRSPETTIESAVARRWAGARSPTSGSISWGVTVDRAVTKDKARKTENDFVIHKPTHFLMLAIYWPLEAVEEAHHCGSEENENKYKCPSTEYITQWAEEQEARSITSLHEGRYHGCALIRNTEVSRQDIEDWMVVVKVGNGKCASKAKEEVQSHIKFRR
jgi:hypothetical protein